MKPSPAAELHEFQPTGPQIMQALTRLVRALENKLDNSSVDEPDGCMILSYLREMSETPENQDEQLLIETQRMIPSFRAIWVQAQTKRGDRSMRDLPAEEQSMLEMIECVLSHLESIQDYLLKPEQAAENLIETPDGMQEFRAQIADMIRQHDANSRGVPGTGPTRLRLVPTRPRGNRLEAALSDLP